ncbi:hypothetical protein P9314_17895 [Paenibacillus validus]|uniref:hypothetical protein n=1 Tax=Paenibacillus validus TaxID=44253 RepID=UPI000FD7D5EF|nr:hypothetical protein [Paenibacillus validus]MED4602543.1 hypothetical protein [Paenibacillus validus]MED4608755.1 hypothetical protein [Paenibacillus validus]
MPSFLEFFYERLKKKEFDNYPFMISLHHGLAYTVQLEDRVTNLLMLPFEQTGLAYIEPNPNPGNVVNVHPYYRGKILLEFEILHGTDLHKPKTEEQVLEFLYRNAWQLHQLAEGMQGSFEDYMVKFKMMCDFLRYFNSVVVIPNRS